MKKSLGKVQFRGKEFNAELIVNIKTAERWARGKTGIHMSNLSPEDVGGMEMPECSVKGEDPENDALWKKYNREEVKLNREIITRFIPEIASLLEEAYTEEKWRKLPKDAVGAFEDTMRTSKIAYNRKLWCSCGCSSGMQFKTDTYKSVHLGDVYCDVYIEICLHTDEDLKEMEDNRLKSAVTSAQYKLDKKRKEIEELEAKVEQARIDALELEKAVTQATNVAEAKGLLQADG